MSTQRWLRTVSLVVVTGLLTALPVGSSWSAPATRRSTDMLYGEYKSQVRGALTGTGKVVVSAQKVLFNSFPVEDSHGNRGTLHVHAVLGSDGRFKGSGHALGRPVTVSGRVEVADRTVRVGRLVCTLIGDGEFGRIIGEKEASQVTGGGAGGGGAGGRDGNAG